MKFKFDTIKNPFFVFVIIPLLNIFVPAFLWGFLRTPDYKEIIPPDLYRNNIIPVLLFLIPLVFFIAYRKKLFWKQMEIVLDHKRIIINKRSFDLERIEFYEFFPGSQVSSGNRDCLNIKFVDSGKIKILPCKSSIHISNYDDFIQEFLLRMESIHPENKEKLISKFIKFILLVILMIAVISYIYFYYNFGSSVAFKMLPGILVAIPVFLSYIFKKKKKPRL